LLVAAHPTLKRGANKHCAYGAVAFARITKSEPGAVVALFKGAGGKNGT
jgi:hypothetical protein